MKSSRCVGFVTEHVSNDGGNTAWEKVARMSGVC